METQGHPAELDNLALAGDILPDLDEAPKYPIFIDSKETILCCYWYISGTLSYDSKCIEHTAILRVYHRVNANRQRIDNVSYFYVPDTVRPGRFFVSEQMVAERLYHWKPTFPRTDVRLINASAYHSAYEAKQAIIQWVNSGAPELAFLVFKEDGEQELVKNMYDPSARRSYDDSGFAPAHRWDEVLQLMVKGDKKPYDVKTRFWRPIPPGKPSDSNPAIFTVYVRPPSVPLVTVDVLKKVAQKACENMGDAGTCYNVIVVDGKNNMLPRDIIQVGHNFFGIFDTWMSMAEYSRMVNNFYCLGPNGQRFGSPVDPWPLRPWPTVDQGKAVDSDLGYISRLVHDVLEDVTDQVDDTQGEGPNLRRVYRYPVVQENLKADVLNRIPTARGRSQKQVMKYVSATEVAQMIWPDALTDQRRIFPKWNAEWLHRLAHSLSGKQHASNLIFGTSECNTDMLRAELAIRNFVLRAPKDWTMNLKTTRRSSQVQGQVRMLNEFVKKPEPTYANSDAYSWAIRFLEYAFTVKGANHIYQPTWVTHFETMSRYVPLRLEVEMDELLWDDYAKLIVPMIQQEWFREYKCC